MNKTNRIISEYKELSTDEMVASDRELLNMAHEAARDAYAPYSEFQVGSAVRMADGSTVLGNNQENAAYPLALCAERVALFAAKSRKPDTAVEAIAVVAYYKGELMSDAVAPCGSCRQVIIEHEHRDDLDMRIILAAGPDRTLIFEGGKNLLPLSFSSQAFSNTGDELI